MTSATGSICHRGTGLCQRFQSRWWLERKVGRYIGGGTLQIEQLGADSWSCDDKLSRHSNLRSNILPSYSINSRWWLDKFEFRSTRCSGHRCIFALLCARYWQIGCKRASICGTQDRVSPTHSSGQWPPSHCSRSMGLRSLWKSTLWCGLLIWSRFDSSCFCKYIWSCCIWNTSRRAIRSIQMCFGKYHNTNCS